MPELAEVETARRHADQLLRGRTIRDVDFAADDKIFFKFVKSGDVRRTLKGARITGTGRRGKYFWFELNRKPWPMFHLGMSGGVSLLGPRAEDPRAEDPRAKDQGRWEGVKLWSQGDADIKTRLEFARLILKFGGGFEFTLRDPRRFGRMWLTEDPLQHPRILALGFDPLVNFPSAKVLGELLGQRKPAIKTVLLDQSLFAGIGNYLADEILFQSRLAPARPAKSLGRVEVQTLRRVLLQVVSKACALDADYERFPKAWLFHHRWGKNIEAQTASGHKIIHQTIGGRTTAWVPDLQS